MSDAEKTEGAGQEAEEKPKDEAAQDEAASPKDEAASPKDEADVASPNADKKPAAASPAYRPPYGFLGVLAAITLAADLGSKQWAERTLGPVGSGKTHPVIENWLQFSLAHNPGGAWGLLQTENPAVRVPFFILVSIVAVGFIVSLYRKLAPDQWALRWGLPLVLGGALGNLFDRILYQYVIDFIDMYTLHGTWVDSAITAMPDFIRLRLFGHARGIGYHWPTYNIADIAIVAGVILMAVDMFTSRNVEKKAAAAK
jgi:signal peptidase II